MTRRRRLNISAALAAMALVFASLGRTATSADLPGKGSAPAQKLRIAIPSPSLSFLPIYVAVQKGFFLRRGFEIELIQMTPAMSAAALINRAVDYTTIPSSAATASAGATTARRSGSSRRSQRLIAGLGVSRRADASSEKHQA